MNKSALLVVPFLFSLAASAQEVKAQSQAPKPNFVLEPGEIELTALIDRCATYLDCNILVAQSEMAGGATGASVRLQKPVSTDRDGCIEFLTTMLARSGYALTWLDDKRTTGDVVALFGPRAREVLARAQHLTPEQVLARPNLKVAVTTVVPLQHTNATIATNALRPFFANTGGAAGASLTIGNVGNNTSMLLSGMQDQVAQAILMLRTADVPPPPDKTPPSAIERIDALEKRVAELEKRLAASVAQTK